MGKVTCEAYTDRGIVGPRGKSAYEQAVEGGYTGTEEEFEAALASDINTVATNISDVNTVGANISNVQTVAGVSSDVSTVAGISSDVSAVSSNSTNISTVAGIATAVNNVASNESAILNVSDNLVNVNTVASNMNSVLATAGDMANIDAVAGNKTNIDTVAGISSDVSAVAGVASDISEVKDNATNISTVATNISDVNTVATNISNVNTAASNMSAIIAAPTQAANAATSASDAQKWAEGTDADVQPLGGTKSSKGWANRAQEIAESIGAIYKPAGSIAFASLPALSADVLGNVYNITDAFTTTADFVEGAGKNYPAGTNVAIVDVGTGGSHSYKFDVLSGFVDLSAYRTASAQDVIDATKANDNAVVHTTGDESIAGTKTFTTKITSTVIETGSGSSAYFQTRKFRGEGNANTYYHAIDFGHGGHDQVDFYEYGGKYVFHKHTGADVGSGDTVLGEINSNGWEGNVKGNLTGNASTATSATKATQDGDGNEISSTYLKLSGGTMTGAINFAGANSRVAGLQLTESGNNLDGGWNWANKDGAGFFLRSSSHSNAGAFGFFARNSSGTTKQLVGNPAGSLTWDGSEVQRASHKAVANGIASLDANTKVPVAQLPVMTGADGANAGTAGTVPAPVATDNTKFLRGDGTWSLPTATVARDDTSITLNGSSQIQTVGVIDQNNTSTAVKTWTGTKAQYDAIVTKDSNTLYNITDDVSATTSLLEALYPVGSIYITTNATCPLSTLISGSSWVQVGSGKVLQGSDLDHTAGTTIEAGLPNITGNLCGLTHGTTDGAFTGGTQLGSLSGTSSGGGPMQVGFSASDSNATYGNSNTVQPPAYVVNIFRRTA